ncbi:Latrophilin-like protein LAT-2 [Geodia barretti]|uniref:Latrophilin-like protein LAT-2 n=2 Tax=Geodia barretti TaxID=519541 RepID=A0AA35XMZ9_GEOBA|nr:Latrophilin-like protein LAT-2 [Geodia barretti]
MTLCLSRRICHCLSRRAKHNRLIDIEEQCRQLCVMPTRPVKSSPPMMGSLSGDMGVCNSVHGHYCRRHTMSGRSVDCARECRLQDNCPTLIEGILEGEFEGSDLDAAVAVMMEFRGQGAHRLPARDILMAHGSFYRVIESNSNAVISHLNNNNSQNLVSLFDDLLSDERQEEWAELQREGEPGQEVLERIETTVHLLGMSHQLQSLDIQLLDHFHYIGSNIEMNVECQDNKEYEYVFNRGLDKAALSVPETNSQGDKYCSRVIAASLSSNLGEFVSNDSNTMVDTDVMTVQTMEAVQGNKLSDITISLPSLNMSGNLSSIPVDCVFWNTNQSQWSTEGVELVSVTETHYVCRSTHLSSFAVLVNVKPLEGMSETEAMALSGVTYLGCGISIICILLTLLCMVVFRETLNKGVLLYIHFNLFLALLLALIIFVFGIETATHIKWLCATVAALLHYLFLCVFCWMLAEGILLYVLVVRAFTTNFKKWYYLLPFGWGTPLFIVAISLGLRYEYYGNNNYCWLSHDKGLVWSFVGPMLAIILVNSVILVLTMVSIARVRSKASKGTGSKNHTDIILTSAKSAIVLLPLLGITWIIGVFAVEQNTTVFAWIFTILNSLQGLMIFVLHILRNRKLRSKMGRRCGLIVQSEKSNYSSSTEYTSTDKREGAPVSMPSGCPSNGDISPSWKSHSGIQMNGSSASIQGTISNDYECQNFTVDFSKSSSSVPD